MSNSETSKIKSFWLWFKQTSTLLGMPLLVILLCVGLQKLIFTFTCQTAGFKCEYSFGATDALAQYMGELVASNPGVDIVAKKR